MRECSRKRMFSLQNSKLSYTCHMKKVEFSLDLDLFGGDYNDSIDADATDTAQNENNSNAGKYNPKNNHRPTCL